MQYQYNIFKLYYIGTCFKTLKLYWGLAKNDTYCIVLHPRPGISNNLFYFTPAALSAIVTVNFDSGPFCAAPFCVNSLAKLGRRRRRPPVTAIEKLRLKTVMGATSATTDQSTIRAACRRPQGEMKLQIKLRRLEHALNALLLAVTLCGHH